MGFEPNTTIQVYKATGVTSSNQPFFTSQGAKMAWYQGHSYIAFESQSYQRENREYARVDKAQSQLRGYDMLAFRNDALDKWIICRITGTEFVNPNTTDIFFVVDPMQTWIEDIVWCDCWVEREMVDDDWNGSLPGWQSLCPEGLEPGQIREYGIYDSTDDIMSGGWDVHVLSAYDASAEPNYSIPSFNGYVMGLNDIITTASGLEGILKQYAEKGRLDGIAGVFMFPKRFANQGAGYARMLSLPTSFDGYVPKNSKVFTSEFCTISITNRQGDAIELAPEYLFKDSNQFQLQVEGALLAGGGGLIAYPNGYMGMNEEMSMAFGVTLPANIQCAYVGNAYANWVAQNKAPLIVEGVGSLGQVAIGAFNVATVDYDASTITEATKAQHQLRSGVMDIYNGVLSAAGTLAKIMSKATNPMGAHGQASSQALAVSLDTYGFGVTMRGPSAQQAESLDNFFSVFGYKVCRMKKPNVNTRPFWNYVKCSPAIINGPMNSVDRTEIEKMLNNGVTFWHVPAATIGDYSPDNRG